MTLDLDTCAECEDWLSGKRFGWITVTGARVHTICKAAFEARPTAEQLDRRDEQTRNGFAPRGAHVDGSPLASSRRVGRRHA